MTGKTRTISGIDVDPRVLAVLQKMADLVDQSVEEYCRDALDCHVRELLDDASCHADIGRRICERWKKSLS